MPPKKRMMIQRYLYQAKPEKVFRALTDAKELTKWFLKDARVQLKKGGKMKFVWSPKDKHENKILDLVPNKRLRMTWPTMGWGGTPKTDTYVTFSLTPKGKYTLLQIEHTGFGPGEEWVMYYAGTYSGWTYYLLNLKSWLEHGIDLRDKVSETVIVETDSKKGKNRK
ncbi:MAG TPA: SRPBCC domain-containing protein [candidate division Zixibacteria bacterium]|nr:SRPBCC domain-containing protein [candidate division Zixibacteria bacterium]